MVNLLSILFIVTSQIKVTLIEILLVPWISISADTRVSRVVREHACQVGLSILLLQSLPTLLSKHRTIFVDFGLVVAIAFE